MTTADTSVPDIATLYSDHHRWLLGWLRGRVGNAGLAADLAQDTFVRILGRPRDVPRLETPRAWLTTIAHGLLVDHVRREALERAYLAAVAALPEALAPSAEDRLLVLETLAAIDALLDGLPAKARRAFLMSRLDEMTYAEIAIALRVSLSSVEKYMAMAVRHCYAVRLRHRQLA